LEKLVYTIWSDRPGEELADELREAISALPQVQAPQLNLPDAAFSGGQEPIRNLLARFDGTVSVWLESRRERAPLESLLDRHCEGFHGYAVCESRPMAAQLPQADSRGRIDSLCQVCLLRKPQHMAYVDWLSTWLDSHTDIAIERQGTIAYAQNIIQAAVTPGAPLLHGIVEECYPSAAYADLGLFFGAPRDRAAMQANIEALMASTARFIPLDGLDRIFTAPWCGTAHDSPHRALAAPASAAQPGEHHARD
jgi:hypothetical protein